MYVRRGTVGNNKQLNLFETNLFLPRKIRIILEIPRSSAHKMQYFTATRIA